MPWIIRRTYSNPTRLPTYWTGRQWLEDISLARRYKQKRNADKHAEKTPYYLTEAIEIDE